MKVRVLPTHDFAEFGSQTQIVLLSINRTEAGQVLDVLNDGLSNPENDPQRSDDPPRAVRYFRGLLESLVDGLTQAAEDAVNTDGRSLTVKRMTETIDPKHAEEVNEGWRVQ